MAHCSSKHRIIELHLEPFRGPVATNSPKGSAAWRAPRGPVPGDTNQKIARRAQRRKRPLLTQALLAIDGYPGTQDRPVPMRLDLVEAPKVLPIGFAHIGFDSAIPTVSVLRSV